MVGVCNSCGAYPSEQTDVKKCQFCPTLVCIQCRANHESVCEVMQKRKKRGEGPTVVRLVYTPIVDPQPAPVEVVEPIDAAIAAVRDLVDESK